MWLQWEVMNELYRVCRFGLNKYPHLAVNYRTIMQEETLFRCKINIFEITGSWMFKKEKNSLLSAVRWLGNVVNTAFSMAFWHYFRSGLYVYSSILELSQINQTTLRNKIICDICSLRLCLSFNYNDFNTAKPKFFDNAFLSYISGFVLFCLRKRT